MKNRERKEKGKTPECLSTPREKKGKKICDGGDTIAPYREKGSHFLRVRGKVCPWKKRVWRAGLGTNIFLPEG